MLRSLIHYWRTNVTVLLSAAVAASVLTGALLVGDSVRGSLRSLTLDRLGEIDDALVANDYIREDILVDLTQSNPFTDNFDAIASAITITGSAFHADTKARASNVNIVAVDEQFEKFFAEGGELAKHLSKQPDQTLPSLVINSTLQAQLRADVGDEVRLIFEKPSDIRRGSLLGRKRTAEVVQTVRFVVTHILGDRGPGRFSLQAHQRAPNNAYISLPFLQATLQRRNKINTILVSERHARNAEPKQPLLQRLLADALRFDDLGLRCVSTQTGFAVESREGIIPPLHAAMLRRAAESLQLPFMSVFTYIANTLKANRRVVPYSTVSALHTPLDMRLGEFRLTDGKPVPALQEHEIVLNSWAANDLRVQPGDTVAMSYFVVGPQDELLERKTRFVLKGIAAMRGLAADPTLTPSYPGIADVKNMADWDPPFPIDLGLIRKKDERYWDMYRGMPKAFVSEATGVKLWGSRFGQVTAIRVYAVDADSEAVQAAFEQAGLSHIDPASFGFVFQAVKQQGLASSTGATDFSGLFIGFSQFLIVAAALLVGLLFRLGVEQRAKEIGIKLALGFPAKSIRRQLLTEGALLACAGAALGMAGAVVYAWLLMTGLRTWWLDAVGSPLLFLHIRSGSLVLGFIISVAVILFSIWMAFRKLSRISPPALLAGVTSSATVTHTLGRTRVIAFASLILAGLCTVLTRFSRADASPVLFFGIGALLLISCLAFLLLWLRGSHRPLSPAGDAAGIIRLAARNSPRNPGRSMLSVALVSSACFVIVAVGAFRQDFGAGLLQKDSGAGGFALWAHTDVPLHYDLNSEDGRFELGFSEDESALLSQAQIVPFRFLPGDDASCLNLYQAKAPRLLGVTAAQIQRGGFGFSQIVQSESNNIENPWVLLEENVGENVIPAFGDANSVQWILHSGLGKDLVMKNAFGREIKLRFVGLLRKSIFQSELLISEEQFLKHFPGRSGYRFFLIDTPQPLVEDTARLLEQTLSDYGFDVATTAERLAHFQAVENTYLSTFQTVGGFGLLLGTLGLGLILIRNVLERRAELAAMRAFGFRRIALALMIVAENAFVLLLGIGIGTVSAVIAVLPHILGDATQVPWLSLSETLLLVFVVGMLSSVVAVRNALRIPLLPALRAE